MRELALVLIAAVALATATGAQAHFGMLLPTDDIVSMGDDKTIGVRAMFIHPFENTLMTMSEPKVFGVRVRGKTTNLLSKLKKAPEMLFQKL